MKTKTGLKRLLSMLLELMMVLTLLSTVALAAEDVDINETNLSDGIFRANVFVNFAIDDNDILSAVEIKAVTSIDVKGKGITSLKGVEYFTAIRALAISTN